MREENDRLKKEADEWEEAARKERLRLQAIAEVERQKAAAALTKAKADAESKKLRDEAAAAAAPDKAKLTELCAALRRLPIPAMKTKKAQVVAESVDRKITELADWIESRI